MSPRSLFSSFFALCMTPLVLTHLAKHIAEALDCTLNAHRIMRCEWVGIDIGGLLHVMNGFNELLVYSLPVGLFFLAAWLIAELLYFYRNR